MLSKKIFINRFYLSHCMLHNFFSNKEGGCETKLKAILSYLCNWRRPCNMTSVHLVYAEKNAKMLYAPKNRSYRRQAVLSAGVRLVPCAGGAGGYLKLS